MKDMLHIWRVNVEKQSFEITDIPDDWKHLGGRGLSARILLDEVPAQCEPLGPHNKLVFAPGLLVGHMLSSCDRISVGAKSPLTYGIKESNAGGSTGLKLTLLGIKALIIEGEPAGESWQILHLSTTGCRFEPADEVMELGVNDAAKTLLDRYGDKVAVAVIGQGGERGLASAGIQNLDKDRNASRIAARGGLGAVMGSKKIKAIVIDATGGEKAPIQDAQAYKTAQKAFTQALMAHPQTQVYADYGTASLARMSNGFGALPTRNFSSGNFEGLETISGEYLRQTILERGGEGETTHACMAGCTIRCSNCYADSSGKSIVTPLEYETIGLMGPNLGIDDLDVIAQLNKEVNDLGLDSIEVGAALGVACEAGLVNFGDGEGILRLVSEIRKNTPLGRILGNGAAVTGKVLGVKRIPVVKGQAISAYEPRAIKGTGVTYATSPQGADHTCGLTIRAKVDHLDPKGQVDLSKSIQINNAGYDTLGACLFAGFGFAAAPSAIRDLLNARYGWEVNSDILQQLGRETIKLEREFNCRAGFTSADDRLPEFMVIEPLPPFNAVFDVPEDELDAIFDW
jgi:aldehyde:ferredoxin oxidoreductase